MQQLYQLGCDWTDNGCMFLHQGTIVLINSIDITNVTHLRTISNIEICASYIVTQHTRKTGKCSTNVPCVYVVEVNEMLGVHSLRLVMLPIVHLKDAIIPDQSTCNFNKSIT